MTIIGDDKMTKKEDLKKREVKKLVKYASLVYAIPHIVAFLQILPTYEPAYTAEIAGITAVLLAIYDYAKKKGIVDRIKKRF